MSVQLKTGLHRILCLLLHLADNGSVLKIVFAEDSHDGHRLVIAEEILVSQNSINESSLHLTDPNFGRAPSFLCPVCLVINFNFTYFVINAIQGVKFGHSVKFKGSKLSL